MSVTELKQIFFFETRQKASPVSLIKKKSLGVEVTRIKVSNKSLLDMGWPDLLSKLAVMMMKVMDNLVSPMISPR
jgi:hypothetical protein